MKIKISVFLIAGILSFSLLNAQAPAPDSGSSAQPDTISSGIKMRASVSSKEVPLNRPLIFTIQVEWFGELSRYEISEVEDPVVRNFTIQSNSSSDRREMVDGELKAIKTFEFEMMPLELGMGYIEGVIVKYIDTVTGEGKHLVTNRLEVKVIEPVAEPGSRKGLIKWVVLFIILVILGVAIFWGRKKQIEKRRRQEEEAAAMAPIEIDYLKQLKASVPLDNPDLHLKDAYSQLSHLVKKYLTEKYELPATTATTEEIISGLKQNDVPESLINNTEEILNKSDVVKFSGGEGERAELERLYTLFEDMLDRNLKESKTALYKES
ncbi:hypothetical protein GF337_13480 [candidate division KSB1 bacterium]|nr:hypothetical protein [candidate division KSB1 bacterium]